MLESIHNDNVIKFIDTFRTDKYIFIATEYCHGGNLQSILDKKGTFSEEEATKILKQLMNGFKVKFSLFRECMKLMLYMVISNAKIFS